MIILFFLSQFDAVKILLRAFSQIYVFHFYIFGMKLRFEERRATNANVKTVTKKNRSHTYSEVYPICLRISHNYGG